MNAGELLSTIGTALRKLLNPSWAFQHDRPGNYETTAQQRISLATDPSAEDHVLEELSHDEVELVRRHVARNPGTSELILRRLATDPEEWVRWAVVQNPNVPESILCDLVNDPASPVAGAAQLKLKLPDPLPRLEIAPRSTSFESRPISTDRTQTITNPSSSKFELMPQRSEVGTLRFRVAAAIADMVSDYRSGEITVPNPKHVNTWIDQFEEVDRLTILKEMYLLLKHFYWSKERVQDAVRSFILDESIWGMDPSSTLREANFFRVSQRGDSHRFMRDLVADALETQFSLSIDECGGSDLFIYLNDCVYSGHDLHYSLANWIRGGAPDECKLIVYHLATHESGLSYASRVIEHYIGQSGKQIEVFYEQSQNISHSRPPQLGDECLWPSEVNGDQYVDAYIDEIKQFFDDNDWAGPLFRPASEWASEAPFSSLAAKDIVESAFLRYGSKLLLTGPRLHNHLRPLGFEVLNSLGFGSLFLTYRNIANNCPLVLWWPHGGWYPLFPRKYGAPWTF